LAVEAEVGWGCGLKAALIAPHSKISSASFKVTTRFQRLRSENGAPVGAGSSVTQTFLSVILFDAKTPQTRMSVLLNILNLLTMYGI